MKNRRNLLILGLGVVVIFALRFFHLEEKPIHHDESVYGWFIIQMWKQGFYHYDPTNYHGPLFFYFAQLSEVLFGRSLWSLRAVPDFFSALTVVYLIYLAITEAAQWWIAVVVMTLSPAAEFFGRSGIQEACLCFGFLVALHQLWGWIQAREKQQALIFFTALAFCFSMKETSAVFVLSLLASAGFFLWPDRNDVLALLWRYRDQWLTGLLLFGALIAAVFSGFIQNPHGAIDFLAAYTPWLKTGTQGSGHEKIFYYWLELMGQNEWATLALLVLPIVSFSQLSRRTRFFVVLGGLHFFIYSIIPYKTPWCLISIQLPIVFAGVLALRELAFKMRNLWAAGICLLAVGTAPVAFSLTLQHPILASHPYIYVQGSYEYKKIDIFFHLNRDLIGNRPLAVAFNDYWPLPYSFVDFDLRYMASAQPVDPLYEVQFYDASEKSRVEKVLGEDFVSKEFLIRDSRPPGVVFIRKALFKEMNGSWDI